MIEINSLQVQSTGVYFRRRQRDGLLTHSLRPRSIDQSIGYKLGKGHKDNLRSEVYHHNVQCACKADASIIQNGTARLASLFVFGMVTLLLGGASSVKIRNS